MMEVCKEKPALANLLDIAHPTLIGGVMAKNCTALNGDAAQVDSLKHSFGYKSHRLEAIEPDSVPSNELCSQTAAAILRVRAGCA